MSMFREMDWIEQADVCSRWTWLIKLSKNNSETAFRKFERIKKRG